MSDLSPRHNFLVVLPSAPRGVRHLVREQPLTALRRGKGYRVNEKVHGILVLDFELCCAADAWICRPLLSIAVRVHDRPLCHGRLDGVVRERARSTNAAVLSRNPDDYRASFDLTRQCVIIEYFVVCV